MNNIVTFIITIIIVLIFLYKIYYNYIFTVKVRSNIDSKYYRVKNNKNKQQSADTMAIISQKIDILLNGLKNEPKNKNIDLLLKRYNKDNLIENINTDSTSYTINKGQEIAICLSDPKTEEIHDINIIIFPVIHEIAHIACKSDGHGKEFINVFIYLLKKSVEYGIYDYEDYNKNPGDYCGMKITNTPLKLKTF